MGNKKSKKGQASRVRKVQSSWASRKKAQEHKQGAAHMSGLYFFNFLICFEKNNRRHVTCIA